MRVFISVLVIIFLCNSAQACDETDLYPDKLFPEVVISTNMGDILVELDRHRAPITVNNFLKYIKAGHYKNTVFHRVEKNYVIQGGGYNEDFEDIVGCGKIFNESGNGLRNKLGTIAMARYDDPHSATSQFFFNLTDSPSLDPNSKNWGYTVFGEIIEGMDVLKSMSNVNTGFSDKLQSDNVPLEAIKIKTIHVK